MSDEDSSRSLPLTVIVLTAGWAAVMYWQSGASLLIPLGCYAVFVMLVVLALDRPLLKLLQPRWKEIGLGIGAGLLMALITYTLWPLAEFIPSAQTEVASLYQQLRLPPGPIRGFPLIFLVILAEELLWRGYLMTRLKRAWSDEAAVLIAALLYAAGQAGSGSPILIVLALACGVVWGALRMWSDELVVPFLTHLVWDLVVLILFPLVGPSLL